MRRPKPHRIEGTNPAQGRNPVVSVDEPEPMLIMSGPMLCRLRVWTDEQWGELPEAGRPAQHTQVPGLGWVVAIPVVCMN